MVLKEIIKNFFYSASIAMSGAMTTIVLLILIFQFMQPVILEKYVKGASYNVAINRASNDDYTYMVYKLCDLKKSEESKIYCVYNFFQSIMEYKVQDQVNSIEFTLTNSSDCKNAMVFYCAVFKNMNLSCQPAFIQNHTWAIVEYDGGYCNIDQRIIDCH